MGEQNQNITDRVEENQVTHLQNKKKTKKLKYG